MSDWVNEWLFLFLLWWCRYTAVRVGCPVLQLFYSFASQGEASDAKWNVKRGVKHENMGSHGQTARAEI